MKIAYQGVKGAYSEAVIIKQFPEAAAIAYDSFDQVFEAVKNNEADYAVLPFDNTIAGSVARNYDLLLKEDLFAIGEFFLRVNHCLLSRKGNKLENISFAYSHPHALEQCRVFLEKNKIKPMPEYDTAGSAMLVSQREDIEEAAIASELCAAIYGLDIISRNIESGNQNITKFLLLASKENIPKTLKREKTSIAFKTKHSPGALINCLQRLAKNNINLSRIESRPIPETPWEYIMYADFEAGMDDDNVKLSLSEMEAASIFVKVLGSYPKGKL